MAVPLRHALSIAAVWFAGVACAQNYPSRPIRFLVPGASGSSQDILARVLGNLITSPLVAMPHAKGGRIKVLATTGAKRDPLLPELPVFADTVPGYEITQWWGVVAPARTPPAILNLLHAEIIKALQSPDVRELLARQGATAQPESPAEFAAYMKAERARIGSLGKKAGITLD